MKREKTSITLRTEGRVVRVECDAVSTVDEMFELWLQAMGGVGFHMDKYRLEEGEG